jgi:hypothetical protein
VNRQCDSPANWGAESHSTAIAEFGRRKKNITANEISPRLSFSSHNHVPLSTKHPKSNKASRFRGAVNVLISVLAHFFQTKKNHQKKIENQLKNPIPSVLPVKPSHRTFYYLQSRHQPSDCFLTPSPRQLP